MNRIELLLKNISKEEIKTKKICELTKYRRGSFPQPYTNAEFYGGEGAMPFVQVADVTENFKLVDKTKNTISTIAQPLSVFVPKGTVIVTLQGTIGRVALTQYDAYVDRTLAIFEEISPELNKKYFAYQLKNKFDYEKQFARGSTIKTITKEEMNEFEIPIPPIEVQNEIVGILDRFSILEENLENELEARNNQYDYWRGELLSFDNKNYKIKKIKNLVSEKCSANGVEYYKMSEIANHFNGLSGKSKTDFENGNYKFITYTNIYNNPSTQLDVNDLVFVGENEKQNQIKYKDILVAGSSESLEDSGMISVVTEEPNENIYLNSFCFGMRLNSDFYNKCNPDYLKHLFRNKDFRKKIVSCSFGVTRYNLSKENFLKIEIPIPPIEVQNEIVGILDKFITLQDKIKLEIELRKKQYDFYKERLLSFEEVNV